MPEIINTMAVSSHTFKNMIFFKNQIIKIKIPPATRVFAQIFIGSFTSMNFFIFFNPMAIIIKQLAVVVIAAPKIPIKGTKIKFETKLNAAAV